MQGIGNNVIGKVKSAVLGNYKHQTKTEIAESELEESEIETEEEEVIEYIKNEAVKLEDSVTLANFASGIKF